MGCSAHSHGGALVFASAVVLAISVVFVGYVVLAKRVAFS